MCPCLHQSLKDKNLIFTSTLPKIVLAWIIETFDKYILSEEISDYVLCFTSSRMQKDWQYKESFDEFLSHSEHGVPL